MTTSCHHPQIQLSNCTDCGIYIYKQLGIQGIKTPTFSHPKHTIRHLKSLRVASSKFSRKTVQHCSKVQVKLLFNLLVSKLNLSRETLALALYYFEHIMSSLKQDTASLDRQRHEIIYAATCVSLAAKRLQRQGKHPNMTALKSILQSDIKKKDFSRAELSIFQHFDYEMNGLTFLDFLKYYLMKGGIFSNQSFRDAERFQRRMNELAWQYLKNGQFIDKNQQSLAAYILFKCRKEFKVSEVWNWHIEYYSKIDLPSMRSIVSQMEVSSIRPYSNILSMNRTSNGTSKLSFSKQSPRKRQPTSSTLNIEQAIQNVKKGYSELKSSRSNSECKLQPVRSSSSVSKFTFRIE